MPDFPHTVSVCVCIVGGVVADADRMMSDHKCFVCGGGSRKGQVPVAHLS